MVHALSVTVVSVTRIKRTVASVQREVGLCK